MQIDLGIKICAAWREILQKETANSREIKEIFKVIVKRQSQISKLDRETKIQLSDTTNSSF